MRSRATLGKHPIHPALVSVPIGAFALSLISDIAYFSSLRLFWAEMACAALAVGIASALVAALPGFVDFSGLPRDTPLRSIATTHMILNLVVVALQAGSLHLRSQAADLPFRPSTAALVLSTAGFVLLGASGWLGGKMVFEQGAGVAAVPPALPAQKKGTEP
jgi:uncharacterized membrane protein